MSDTTTPMIELAHAKVIAEQILRAVGAHTDHARATVDNLLFADRSGIASHGLLRLPLYAAAVSAGGINRDPQMRWVTENTGAGLLDADGAFGQVAMEEALRWIESQRGTSASVTVAVQSSSHFGAGGYWTQRLAESGWLAIGVSSTGPTVAPFGATRKVLGTNPLSISLPAGTQTPLTADLATSTGAYGKVIGARNAGTSIPEGWAVDEAGHPTTDPAAAMAGALTAFGGHKGSAVAVLIEGLSVVLGGSRFAFETEDIWSNPGSRMNVGHLVIAVDPAAFAGAEQTAARVQQLRDTVRAAGPDVRAPGDPEEQSRTDRLVHIPLAHSTIEAINQLAEQLGAPPLEPASPTQTFSPPNRPTKKKEFQR
ncbi:Ldh family oxidoreductase [Microcella alkaliphila]|jgi:LDH2 family malate/lactate/ureidoglycolate dehydrogenase|uniref:Malate/lactate dehydrogenase n=1 Tax=Microcella alkaliphila TaxID=279828 RepID=A0A0U5BC55_9MICO|nr:Ldh family oxidoreductase [Microcella alkaliphila]BAU33316.1 malate/lactate dehydrogenase [Microcella alkaliphila]